MTVERYGYENYDDQITAYKTWGGLTWESWKIWGRSGNDRLTGGEDNDFLYGEEGDDTLIGRGDDDHLDGGSGMDTMYGGTGSDSYMVDNRGDRVIEYSNEGSHDEVISKLYSYTLPEHVEDLILSRYSPTGSYAGTGNSSNNKITGNDLGNNLYGLSGQDTLIGYGGNDILDPGSGADKAYGGDGNDIIYGDSSGDELYGGADNDTYHVYNTGVKIVENTNEGLDTAYIYADNFYAYNVTGVEKMILKGNVVTAMASYAGMYIEGNSLNNKIYGSGGVDTFYGGDGNDTLDGGFGNDWMLGQNHDDRLVGGQGDDVLIGGEGKDHLIGAYANKYNPFNEKDTLIGEGGRDIFWLGDEGKVFYMAETGGGYAIINDFNRAQSDRIQVSATGNNRYSMLQMAIGGVGSSAVDTAIYCNNDLIGVVKDNTNVSMSDLSYVGGGLPTPNY